MYTSVVVVEHPGSQASYRGWVGDVTFDIQPPDEGHKC